MAVPGCESRWSTSLYHRPTGKPPVRPLVSASRLARCPNSTSCGSWWSLRKQHIRRWGLLLGWQVRWRGVASGPERPDEVIDRLEIRLGHMPEHKPWHRRAGLEVLRQLDPRRCRDVWHQQPKIGRVRGAPGAAVAERIPRQPVRLGDSAGGLHIASGVTVVTAGNLHQVSAPLHRGWLWRCHRSAGRWGMHLACHRGDEARDTHQHGKPKQHWPTAPAPRRVGCACIVHRVTPDGTEKPWPRLRGASEALRAVRDTMAAALAYPAGAVERSPLASPMRRRRAGGGRLLPGVWRRRLQRW